MPFPLERPHQIDIKSLRQHERESQEVGNFIIERPLELIRSQAASTGAGTITQERLNELAGLLQRLQDDPIVGWINVERRSVAVAGLGDLVAQQQHVHGYTATCALICG